MAFSFEGWIPHQGQIEYLECGSRFIANRSGRQSSKTAIGVVKFVQRALTDWGIPKKWRGPRYYLCYGATVSSSKETLWRLLNEVIPKKAIKKINISEHKITLVNGAVILMKGGENVTVNVGNSLCGVLVDEAAYQKPGIFDTSILPMLYRTDGWAIVVGTPTFGQRGSEEHKERCEDWWEKSKTDPGYSVFHWSSEEVMTEDEIEFARGALGEFDYREQILGEWVTRGNQVYYAFSEENLVEGTHLDHSKPVFIGCDFNVDFMSWVFAQETDIGLTVFEEFRQKDTNTESTVKQVLQRFPENKLVWYGDPAGNQRKTSAGALELKGNVILGTDWLTIQNACIQSNRDVLYRVPSAHPSIDSRVGSVNRALRSFDGNHHVFIDRNCKNLIYDLKAQAYKAGKPWEGGARNMGHASDALGYMIYVLHPDLKKITKKTERFSFSMPEIKMQKML